MNEEWSKTGKEAKHRETGEKTYEYAKVDKEGRKTGEREYRNAQGKSMGEAVEQIDEISVDSASNYIKKRTFGYVKTMKGQVQPSDVYNKMSDKHKVGINRAMDRVVKPVKEEVEQIEEGKMGELHADLSDHLDKHIDNYKKVGGADHLGHKTTQVATKIAKLHNIQQHHAQKFVNDYVENRLKESTDVPFDPPYTKVKGTVTDKSGAKHTPMSRARDLARQAVKKQSQNLKTNKQVVESRKSQIVKEIVRGKKKESPEKFQSDPVVTDITTKSQTM
jgi:hypothetical protein